MPFVRHPSPTAIREFLAMQCAQNFTYPEVGASLDRSPVGYDIDHNRVQVGKGEADYIASCSALRRWAMFPHAWTEVVPHDAPLEVGNNVAVLFRVCGLWWLNAARIVYVIDESHPVRRFGFAYGTLPEHVEQGEERFSIEWLVDDTVWYDIRAFSRPRKWFVKMSYPFARRLQRRFVRESQMSMRHAVAAARETP